MKGLKVAMLTCLSLAITSPRVEAQGPDSTSITVYGFAMLDAMYDFKQNHPDWFDTMRPTKLPSFANEFGEDGRTHFSARQSRFGVRADRTTSMGPMKAVFEFEMFGTGVDAGQTTIRLRHAYGQLGQWGAGQTWSPFMDIDVFPNTIEYWGPNGMAFFRNVQIFWQPKNDDNGRITVALERPGASGDQGIYADRVELQNIAARFPLPDLSAEWRLSRGWGYLEAAGIVRAIYYDDLLTTDPFDLSGNEMGWGLSLSSNWKPNSSNTLRLQVVYGEGTENYFNDAPVDIGVETNPGDPVRPLVGKALPNLGLVAYLDHTWSPKWSTAVGWSMVDIDNSNGQAPSAYSLGQYASINALYTPVTNVMMGTELQWGNRENFSDGFTSDDFRVQVSFRYNFSKTFAGGM